MQRTRDAQTFDVAADPYIWGPVMWDLLFGLAFHSKQGRPHTDSHGHLVALFALLPEILPCPSCRSSCQTFCRHLPPQSIQAGDEAQWLWTLKDTINQKLSRKPRSYCDIKRRYTTFPALLSDAAILMLGLVVAVGCHGGRAAPCVQFFHLLVVLRPSLATHLHPLLGAALSDDKPCPSTVVEIACTAVTRLTGVAPDVDRLMSEIVVAPKDGKRTKTKRE